MLDEARAREIFEVIRKAGAADEVEVFLDSTQSALTRFANNAIHQNVAEEGLQVSVRALVEGRTARTTTNKTDADSLKRVVERAVESARWQPPNPDLLPMPGPQSYQPVQRYCEETAALSPDARADAVAKAIARAKSSKLTAAGILSNSMVTQVLMNSRGLYASHRETKAEFSITY
ncbi:MAG: PmbA/TldA family metallopeptidase, partial [Candidatus Acidiferrales bacterium]